MLIDETTRLRRQKNPLLFGSLYYFECENVLGDDKNMSDDRKMSSGEIIILDIDKSGVCAFK